MKIRNITEARLAEIDKDAVEAMVSRLVIGIRQMHELSRQLLTSMLEKSQILGTISLGENTVEVIVKITEEYDFWCGVAIYDNEPTVIIKINPLGDLPKIAWEHTGQVSDRFRSLIYHELRHITQLTKQREERGRVFPAKYKSGTYGKSDSFSSSDANQYYWNDPAELDARAAELARELLRYTNPQVPTTWDGMLKLAKPVGNLNVLQNRLSPAGRKRLMKRFYQLVNAETHIAESDYDDLPDEDYFEEIDLHDCFGCAQQGREPVWCYKCGTTWCETCSDKQQWNDHGEMTQCQHCENLTGDGQFFTPHIE